MVARKYHKRRNTAVEEVTSALEWGIESEEGDIEKTGFPIR